MKTLHRVNDTTRSPATSLSLKDHAVSSHPLHKECGCGASPNVDQLLHSIHPSDIITITCIDYRERPREGYLLTSAGNIPHPHLMEDLHLVLNEKKALILRCHTDCAKSKAELPRGEREDDIEYSERLERHTLNRMWRDAQVLLRDPEVADAMKGGMVFLMARFNTTNGKAEYFHEESNRLVEEICGVRQRSLIGKREKETQFNLRELIAA